MSGIENIKFANIWRMDALDRPAVPVKQFQQPVDVHTFAADPDGVHMEAMDADVRPEFQGHVARVHIQKRAQALRFNDFGYETGNTHSSRSGNTGFQAGSLLNPLNSVSAKIAAEVMRHTPYETGRSVLDELARHTLLAAHIRGHLGLEDQGIPEMLHHHFERFVPFTALPTGKTNAAFTSPQTAYTLSVHGRTFAFSASGAERFAESLKDHVVNHAELGARYAQLLKHLR